MTTVLSGIKVILSENVHLFWKVQVMWIKENVKNSKAGSLLLPVSEIATSSHAVTALSHRQDGESKFISKQMQHYLSYNIKTINMHRDLLQCHARHIVKTVKAHRKGLQWVWEDPVLLLQAKPEASNQTNVSLQGTFSGRAVWAKGVMCDTLWHTMTHWRCRREMVYSFTLFFFLSFAGGLQRQRLDLEGWEDVWDWGVNV